MFNYGVNYSQFKVVNNFKFYFLNISSSVYLQNTRICKRLLLHKLLETFHVLSLSVNLMLSAAQSSLRGAQSLAGGARWARRGEGGRRAARPASPRRSRCQASAATRWPRLSLRSAPLPWTDGALAAGSHTSASDAPRRTHAPAWLPLVLIYLCEIRLKIVS